MRCRGCLDVLNRFKTFTFKHLTPELNPSAQRRLPRFFTGILIFKRLTARRLYKSFGVKGLMVIVTFGEEPEVARCQIR
jgi:hypothetical protein